MNYEIKQSETFKNRHNAEVNGMVKFTIEFPHQTKDSDRDKIIKAIAALPDLIASALGVLDADSPKEIELARKSLRAALNKALD